MRKQHEDFPPNTKMSQKTKKVLKAKQNVPMRDEDELIEETVKVIKPNIRRPRIKKKSLIQRAIGAIVGGEDGENVGQYIMWDVLIPAAKATIQDMVTSGIEMLLFGEASGRRGSRRDRSSGKTIVSYGSYYKGDRGRSHGRDREMMRVPGYHNRLEGITFESRGEAETILDGLVDLLDEYETVSIADFYELSSLESEIQMTDNGWGWDNLSRAKVIRTPDGYEIDFPRPKRLD